jgi:hypothetical protein
LLYTRKSSTGIRSAATHATLSRVVARARTRTIARRGVCSCCLRIRWSHVAPLARSMRRRAGANNRSERQGMAIRQQRRTTTRPQTAAGEPNGPRYVPTNMLLPLPGRCPCPRRCRLPAPAEISIGDSAGRAASSSQLSGCLTRTGLSFSSKWQLFDHEPLPLPH